MFIIYKYSDKEIDDIVCSATIIVDSREKCSKHITDWFDKKGIKWCNDKLDWGDYTVRIESPAAYRDFTLQDVCTIERKANLEELSGNMTHDRDRFNAEFLRSRGAVYLLIENAEYQDIELGNYNTKFNKKSFRASLTAFEHRYNLHTVYMKDTNISGYFIYTTLIGALKSLLKKGVI